MADSDSGATVSNRFRAPNSWAQNTMFVVPQCFCASRAVPTQRWSVAASDSSDTPEATVCAAGSAESAASVSSRSVTTTS
ncbi:hypothetical protein [Gordonia polyisoprenivorans]|uniref:hypothetical protein n=1 Tax=Gordonia polyisoprenivorans TaxID=84595 RepID=UPI001FCB1EF4|nr:hypothetical protein [Gordonia polyisoprenivorans]